MPADTPTPERPDADGATPEEIRYISCERKRPYSSFAQAEKVARRILKKFGGMMTPYHCSYCGAHHLHTERAKSRRRRGKQLLRKRWR